MLLLAIYVIVIPPPPTTAAPTTRPGKLIIMVGEGSLKIEIPYMGNH